MYRNILRREAEVGTNATPGLNAVLQMARWRQGFLDWQSQAERATRDLKAAALPASPATVRPPNTATP